MARNFAIEGSAPLYKEVEREIMQCLARGEWKPGDRLPSEQELADRLGVAVFTIRAGIQKLVDSGILLRRQGKGTFVALHRARPLRNQYLRIFSNAGEGLIKQFTHNLRGHGSYLLGVLVEYTTNLFQRLPHLIC